jgi:hypothetical protein
VTVWRESLARRLLSQLAPSTLFMVMVVFVMLMGRFFRTRIFGGRRREAR